MRVKMGSTIAAHHGHRLPMLIAEIVEDRAEDEDWTRLYSPNARLSDYFFVIAVRRQAALIPEQQIPLIFQELAIILSEKDE